MTTKLEVYNRALDLIGVKRLVSLTVDRDARYALDGAYDYILQYCLEQAMWEFAMRTLAMTATAPPPRTYGFSAAFTVPPDLVHTYLIGTDESISPPTKDVVQADRYFFSRVNTIYVRYVSKDTSFGGDLSKWPNIFARYFSAELASEVAFTLTRTVEIATMAASIAANRLLQARATEAVMASTGMLPYNVLARRELIAAGDIEEPFPFPVGAAGGNAQ